MNDGGGGGESFFATALTFLAITRLETLATQATPPLAQARAKPQEVFSLGYFSRLWFGRVFALVFCSFAARSFALSPDKPPATH